MTKYSNEFKVKAIKMVLKGNSISHVTKILNMPDIAPQIKQQPNFPFLILVQFLHGKSCIVLMDFLAYFVRNEVNHL